MSRCDRPRSARRAPRPFPQDVYKRQKFYLSPVYVSQMFRNKMGVNFLSYLTHLRIEKSKILLMTSQKSIAEIAGSVGFKDYRVYSRAVSYTHLGDRIIPYPELNNSIGDMLQALAVGQVTPQKLSLIHI